MPGNFADVPKSAEVTRTYADGRKIVLLSRGKFEDRFIRFVGDEGWIQVDDATDATTAQPADILKRRRTASRSWTHPEGHIANICLRLGRELNWDPKTECFDDAEANRMISRAMRPPWHL